MRKYLLNWQVLLGAGLISLSAVLYYIHFLIFRDVRHIFIYLLGDIAFIPIEVLIVTIIIHQLLEARAKSERMEKLNMVIGVFFSEVGTELLEKFSKADEHLNDLKGMLQLKSELTEKNFDKIKGYVDSHAYEVKVNEEMIADLKGYLCSKRDFLLRLLENPNLLEHETLTDMFRAVFHMTEELSSRSNLKELPTSDYIHIAGDIKRAYKPLVLQWVLYMKHLRSNFPYLYSLAMRTNPFDSSASIIVK
jgi:hypothetical protein